MYNFSNFIIEFKNNGMIHKNNFKILWFGICQAIKIGKKNNNTQK